MGVAMQWATDADVIGEPTNPRALGAVRDVA
jgi:hypothetical protein